MILMSEMYDCDNVTELAGNATFFNCGTVDGGVTFFRLWSISHEKKGL